jgi:hypothetical protein
MARGSGSGGAGGRAGGAGGTPTAAAGASGASAYILDRQLLPRVQALRLVRACVGVTGWCRLVQA